MIKLAMAGAAGRMGQAILRLASENRAFKVSGAIESSKCPAIGQDMGTLLGKGDWGVEISSKTVKVLEKSDVLIDFTHASALKKNLQACIDTKTAYVIGTTNLSKKDLELIKKASRKIPIVQSPNMSVGVNLLFELSRLTASILDESYNIEMTEIHHRNKKDSPSGTAMKLLEVVAAARKRDMDKDAMYGRKGDIGARTTEELGVLALRGGDVIGDHTVFFLGDGERVELTHRASSRDAFAKGSLVAAKFVAKQTKGLYDMAKVLGIK